jgi:hypothetical protein
LQSCGNSDGEGTSAFDANANRPRKRATEWLQRVMPILPILRRFGKGIGVGGTTSLVWEARPGTVACALLAAIGAATVAVLWSAASEADVPHYQRRAASEMACQAAADEIARLPMSSRIIFMDDCRRANVTPLTNKPGLVIVTRVIEEQRGQATARKTYSALMDGRRIDAWRTIKIAPAPNELSVVVSPDTPTLAQEVAEQPIPSNWSR